MVSWAVYPALDPNLPAGLSPAIIGQELRGRNAFAGVTITDALEAGALTAFGTTGQKAVTAAGAGMDLILCSAQNVTQAEAAVSALATALGNGQLDPVAFNDAVNRVNAARRALLTRPANVFTTTGFSPYDGRGRRARYRQVVKSTVLR